MKTIGVRAPTSKTHAICAVRPERGGKAETCPDAGDCYVIVIISEFSSQRPMRLTHGTQIKSVADEPVKKQLSRQGYNWRQRVRE